MANQLTPWDVVTTLLPYIGAGGFTTIIVAWISFRSAQAKGRQGEPEKAGLGISALLADSGSINRLALAIESGTLEMKEIRLFFETVFKEQLGDAVEEHIKIRRALEELASNLRHRKHD